MSEPALGYYDGSPVVGSTVSIRNTGDGLSDAMKVDPVKLPRGEHVYVVLECEVEKHRYDPEDKDFPGGAAILVNMLKAGRATLIDGDLVRQTLDEQQRKIDEAAGQLTLDTDDGEPQPVGEVLDEALGNVSVLEIAEEAEEQFPDPPEDEDGEAADG